ncbi:alpha/beta hydrolase [Croceibacterium mercuriale]|uniref:Palmitoyl-protein thioesterase ABHD10, mitochondrial n=1 Tax=Croceibacterium mercuriale TaxID=1572751 RepID=A0A0B2BTE2_9SPHN|nr:alpha/beta hydrolase [Croceibacterium mercuriale]KHL24823.1 alpha/beta hydrolase [Croceibacterium mercuriale]
MAEPQFFAMPDGRRIAFRLTRGTRPVATVLFLPGYMSDMSGGKATALFDQAQTLGHGCLLLDYSGCGESDGAFTDGSLTRWADEAVTLAEGLTDGPLVLVGSSMGGWLMLLVALRLRQRVAALVGIAPAPDFTDWGFDAREQALLASGGTLLRPNDYGHEPTPTHPLFWADGQASRLLGAPIPLTCPMRLLHGQADDVVPPALSLRLADRLASADVQVTLVKDGDHRLSTPEQIALLLRTVAALVESTP